MLDSSLAYRLRVRKRNTSKDAFSRPLKPKVRMHSFSTLPKQKLQPISPYFRSICSTLKQSMVAGVTPTSSSLVKLPPLEEPQRMMVEVEHGDFTQWNDPIELIRELETSEVATDNFWYCNMKGDFYDYEFVGFEERDSLNYLTISMNGITHMLRGNAMFYTLTEWINEITLYRKLKKIRFFQNFRGVKNFTIWKMLRRNRMMSHTAHKLSKKFILLNRYFQKTFRGVRTITYKIYNTKLLHIKLTKVRNLNKFLEDQERCRRTLMNMMVDIEKRIKELIKRMCKLIVEKNTKINEEVEERNSKKLPYTEQALVRSTYVHVCLFIRLVDFVVIQAKLDHAFASITHLLEYFNGKMYYKRRLQLMVKPSQPIFYIKTEISELNLLLAPSAEDIKIAVHESIIKSVYTLLNNKLLIQSSEFNKFKKLTMNDRIEVKYEPLDYPEFVLENQVTLDIKQQIFSIIDNKFSSVLGEVDKHRPFMQLYKVNSRFRVATLARKTILQIKMVILGYNSQLEEMRGISELTDFEFLRLDLSLVKEFVLPSPQQCLQAIQDFLPNFAHQSCIDLQNSVKEQNSVAIGTCQSVEDFVKQQTFFKDLEVILPDFHARMIETKELLHLLDDFDFYHEEDLDSIFYSISSGVDILDKKLAFFFQREETEKAKFSRKLKQDVVRVHKQTENLQELMKKDNVNNPYASPAEMVIFLDSIQGEIKELQEDCYNFNCWEVELGIEPSKFANVNSIVKDFSVMKQMWKSLQEWSLSMYDWEKAHFSEISVNNYVKEVGDHFKVAQDSYVLEKYGSKVPAFLNFKLAKFVEVIPIVEKLRSPDLQEAHWAEISQLIGKNLPYKSNKFTLGDLLELKLTDYLPEIANISLKAQKEREIDYTLLNLVKQWDSIDIAINHDKKNNTYYLLDIEELSLRIDEGLVTLATLFNNKYVGAILDSIEAFYSSFRIFAEVFELWQKCHRLWMEMDKIFRNPEVTSKLKDNYKMFVLVDFQYRDLLRLTMERPNALKACTGSSTLTNFKDWLRVLERLQKNIETHLDQQRVLFPRYYFLSNEELLVIISNSQDPKIVQKFFGNMFQNILKLEFGTDKSDAITGIVSHEKEVLPIPSSTKTKGTVEEWLKGLENAMQNSIKGYLIEASKDITRISKKELIWKYVTQIVSCVEILNITSSVEQSLTNHDQEILQEVIEGIYYDIDDYTLFIREKQDYCMERKLSNMIGQQIHYRDIIEMIKEEGISTIGDFRWQQQLRYYWDFSIDGMRVKQLQTVYDYCYEYLGAAQRLVNTPLTDRCWLTLSTAFKLNMGGALSGPAGTGKTESVKDLAKCIGKYCVVFNCSEQMSIKIVNKIMVGLCQTGAWSSFDEFNRIDVEVLSIMAQQVRAIKRAKDQMRDEINIDDMKVSLNSSLGIYVTMNLNYQGRTELPDNLKVLLRPMSMTNPDKSIIIEVILSSEGFLDSKPLSVKIVRFLELANMQLSQQRHYEFGLRSIISALKVAGDIRRESKTTNEEEIIVRILKQSSLGRQIEEDVVLFFNLLHDVFPEVDIYKEDYSDFRDAVKKSLELVHIQPTDEVVEKVVQLYSTLKLRYGAMILGNGGCGKTTFLKVLISTLEQLAESQPENPEYFKVTCDRINPKAMNIGRLFGHVDPDSNEWIEGEAAKIFKIHNRMKGKCWIVFDGPIDSIWVENLNSVLDDNKMLCLANQERIKLRNEQRVIFEIDNLIHASPASISRCGVLYISDKVVNRNNIFSTYLARQLSDLPESIQEHLLLLTKTYLGTALKLRKSCRELVPTTKHSLVFGFCSLLHASLKPVMNVFGTFDIEKEKRLVDKVFVFALIWSASAGIASESLMLFENSLTRNLSIDMPRGYLFDFFVNTSKPGGEFKNWETMIGPFNFNPSLSFYEMFVPTIDTVRIPELMRLNLRVKHPTFMTGNSGVGKTKLIKRFLNSMSIDEEYHIVREVFTAGTTVKDLNQVLDSRMDAKRGTLEGPNGAHSIIFIDDVNLPKLNEWDSQPVIELLRDLIENGEMLDPDKERMVKVLNASYICCAAPAVGGRNPTSVRFNRHFHLVTVPDVPEDHLRTIFKSILDGFLKPFVRDVSSFCNTFVSASVHIFLTCKEELKPTPSKSFYNFSFRDIQRVFQGMLRATPRAFSTSDSFIKLWLHENLRVYYDRLLHEDRAWFISTILSTTNQYFRRSYTFQDVIGDDSIIFCDFDSQNEISNYAQVYDLDQLLSKVKENLMKNSTSSVNEFILYKEAIVHVCKLTRIFGVERGHALIIGTSGVGKKSIVRLAALVVSIPLRSIIITKSYDVITLREDIKSLYLDFAQQEASPVAFMLSEDQIIDECFLEDINTMLSSISILNMFNKEDLEILNQNLHHLVTEDSEYSNVYECFIERIRKHLRIVFCFRMNQEVLLKRFKHYPSLSSACNIIFMDTWSPESLVAVATKKIAGLKQDKLPGLMVSAYQQVEALTNVFYDEQQVRVYATPKIYLAMLNGFSFLQKKYESERTEVRSKLQNGCDQISKSKSEIIYMENYLQELLPQLEKKKEETEEISRELEVDTYNANIEKNRLEAEEREVNQATEQYKVLRRNAEKELKQALPVLEDAIRALKNLSPADISEIRTFSSPPALTLYTLQAIAILFEKPQTWEAIKKMLQSNFLDKLQNFSRKSIKPATLAKLKKKISENPNFTPEQVGQHNVASKSLCKWVFAIENYTRVWQEFKPLKAKLQKMNSELKSSQSKLKEARASLTAEFNKVKALEDRLQKTLEQKQELDEKIHTSNIRIARAKTLTESLKEEYLRWESQLESMEKETKFSIGHMFLSAACIAYYGPFTYEYRKRLINGWMSLCEDQSIPVKNDFNLIDIIGKPSEIRAWNLCSLPLDTFSVTNAIIVARSQRVPLIYDPQHQAIKWLKNMETENGLKIIKENETAFWNALESSIQLGIPVILRDIKRSVNPLLDSLLEGYSQKKPSVMIGRNNIPVTQGFRMYLLSNSANLNFSPDSFNKATLINFKATPEALEEQLLIEVVRILDPRLEKVKNKLLLKLAEAKNELEKLEDTILQSLANTEVNILDDPNIVPELERVNSVVTYMNKRIAFSEKNQEENENARNIYRPIAVRGTLLYCVVSDLSKINCMYHFSLSNFIKRFKKSIDTSYDENEMIIKVNVDSVTKTIIRYVNIGLFNSHKNTFLFLVGVQLLILNKEISEDEWFVFIRGESIASTLTDIPKENLHPGTFSDSTWKLLCLLESVCPVFAEKNMLEDLSENPQKWTNWVRSDQSHLEFLEGYSDCSQFHKLLLLKEVHPEKMLYFVYGLIQETLGEEYLQAHNLSIQDIAREISNKMYSIFLVSPGDDPMSYVYKLVSEMELPDRVETITMGKGQDLKAKQSIEKGCERGNWVVLENCHLSKTMLRELENYIDYLLDKQEVHKDFRLFLTTFPTPDFPPFVLQNGFKLTIEQPKGVKFILQKSIEYISTEFTDLKDKSFLRIAFCTSLFHGVINERQKFGARCWSAPYEFNHSDLDTSLKMISKMNLQEVDLDGMRKLLADIVYGGRINFLIDKQHLWAISQKFFPSECLDSSVSFTNSGVYKIPSEISVASFLDYARALPYEEETELYGLDGNAQIAAEIEQSSTFLNSLAKLAPLKKIQGLAGAESLFLEQIDYLMRSLPSPINSIALKKHLANNKDTNALIVFFLQESERFDHLLSLIKSTLSQLKLAFLGLSVLSVEFEEASASIEQNQVPLKWKELDPGCNQPLGHWVVSFRERMDSLRTYLKVRPKSYWLGTFIYPIGFFSSVLQTFSRSYSFPIEIISFSFDFQLTLDETEELSEDSVYVHGLHMEGCTWNPDKMNLADSVPGEIFSKAPHVLFEPIDNHYVEPEDYLLPLYKTNAREGTYLLNVECPSDKDSSYWTLRGAALFCQVYEK